MRLLERLNDWLVREMEGSLASQYRRLDELDEDQLRVWLDLDTDSPVV